MTNQEFRKELKQDIKQAKLIVEKKDKEHPNSHHYDKLTTQKNYFNIVGLYNFAKRHEELTDEQIKKLIVENRRIFKFLEEYVSTWDEAIQELRLRGPAIANLNYRGKIIEEYYTN